MSLLQLKDRKQFYTALPAVIYNYSDVINFVAILILRGAEGQYGCCLSIKNTARGSEKSTTASAGSTVPTPE